ncbi:MAG: ADP-ribosylglycohydrolase family protein, partial [Pseudobutyrivibrio sp.]|nr:ADP-ribosylglycohydrolase family protein [Pseudobutyrivibrio sp.]
TTIAVARAVTEITHKDDAVTAAETLAALIYLARRQKDKNVLMEYAKGKGYDISELTEKRLEEIRDINRQKKNEGKFLEVYCMPKLTFESALFAFFYTDNFKECIRTAISLGTDSDTIACMAGALAEAYYGDVPMEWQDKAYKKLAECKCLSKDIQRIKDFRNHVYQLPEQ